MNKLRLLFFFFLLISFIHCCNYVSIGANKEKCEKSSREDKTKTCCYVKIKKHGYTLDFCAEIKHDSNSIEAYKNELKKTNSLSSVKVSCSSKFINPGILLYIILLSLSSML